MDWENLPYAEKNRIRSAFGVIIPAVFVPVVALVCVVAYVQLFQTGHFRKRAEENRTRTIVKLAPRGRVYDRSGMVIADNRPCVKAFYYPFEAKGTHDTNKIIEAIFPDAMKRVAEALRTRRATALCEELSREQLFMVLSLRHRIPGIAIVTEYRRRYPEDNLFAHVVGYVSAITSDEYRTLKSRNYQQQDFTGKAGVERVYEQYLRGVNGAVVTEIDASGVTLGIVRDYEPIPGNEVHTTLDGRLQRAAHTLLASSGYRGAVVGIDPRNGAVRVFVSYPDFNPNDFISYTAREKRKVAVATGGKPEFNRAVMGAYPPGSIVKPVFLLGGLEEDRIAACRRFDCQGGLQVGNRFFRCWYREGHGWLAAIDAVKDSCDVYFYQLGMALGPDALEKWMKLFGASRKTGIDLPFEVAGSCPGRRWKHLHHKAPWYDGDTANFSIGQGGLTMSVVQMAVMTAALANRGVLWRPYVVDRVVDRHGVTVLRTNAERIGTIKAEESHWQTVEQSMIAVVNRGTGGAARIPGIVLAGKTGTSQNPHGPDHALFVCYGPVREGEVPELALAVMVEHGLRGGGIAARIARGVFQALVDASYDTATPLSGDAIEGAYGD